MKLRNRYKQISQELRKDTLPVFRLFGQGKFLEAGVLAETLLGDLSHSSDPLDKLEVSRCYLRFLIQFMRFERDGCWDCSAVQTLLAELQMPMATELGNHERMLTMIQLLTNAGTECKLPLNEEIFMQLLENDDLLFRDAELWLSVCHWAFVNRYSRPLEMGCEYFISHRDHSMYEEVWIRVNLMNKLLRRTATRQDVAAYVDCLRLVPQIMEFREDILPVAREQFLWDEGMEQKMLMRLTSAGRREDHFTT